MRRVAGIALGIVAAAFAAADQSLLMPTARRLAPGGLRAELWGDDRLAAGNLTLGLPRAFEMQLSEDAFGGDPGRPTASLAYYYLSPIADIAPGLAAGILDAANETTDGRRAYAVATMNRSIPGLDRFGYVALTAGFEAGRRSAPMAGFNAPLARSVALIGEYDGYRFNVGLEQRLGGGAYARIALRGGAAYVVVGIRR